MAEELNDPITNDLDLSSNTNGKVSSEVLKYDEKNFGNENSNDGKDENSKVEESLTIEDELQQKDSKSEDNHQSSSKDVTEDVIVAKTQQILQEKNPTEKKQDVEDEEETIEVTEETFDPKEFEDEDEVRDDWMQPETKSSNEFIDRDEHADMPETTTNTAQQENAQLDWIKDEFDNNNSTTTPQLHEDEDDDDDEILLSPENRALMKKDPLWLRRIVRGVVKGVGTIVRGTANGVRRVIRKVGSGFKKAGKAIHGVVKSIARSKVGRFFGKIAKKVFDFFKCAIPGLEYIDHCARDAIRSAGSCLHGKCRMKIGGRGSSCLRFSLTKSFTKSYGPATFSGYVKPSIGLGVEAYLNTGKIAVTLYGSVAINPKLRIRVHRSASRTYQRRIPLTQHAIRLFQKFLVVTIGGVPVPVLIEVKVQPVARLKLTASASGSFDASITLQKDARIALDNARIEYEPGNGLPKLSTKGSQNFNNLIIAKTVVLQGQASLSAAISIGAEVIVSINGVPLKMYPALQFVLTGTVTGNTNNGGCISGSLKLSTNLKMLIIPDVKKFTSVSRNFNKACSLMVDFTCLATGAKILGCFHKSFNPCGIMKSGCNEFGKALEKIPNPIQKNPRLAEFYLWRGQFTLWKVGQCNHRFLPQPRSRTVPLYRYWNPQIVDHFYTANFKELGHGRNGWKYEGVQCRLLPHRYSGSVPLYRYWLSGRDHFYTTSVKEIGTSKPGARGRYGYISEGITGYCYPRRRSGLIPLYRYWKPRGRDHFYTTNWSEIRTTVHGRVGRYGYRSEGIACYVYKA